jgi:hypothetical protein
MRRMTEFAEQVQAWFAERIPEDWYLAGFEVAVDREEILVEGEIDVPDIPKRAAPSVRASACKARLDRFRDETRAPRASMSRDGEALFGRKISWGATCGEEHKLFTQLSVPVMTRLRMNERAVLDTLVDASVARSRSDALAWCVRLVGANQARWIDELRDALVHVERVRADGPPLTD